jgi:hypothetical protein
MSATDVNQTLRRLYTCCAGLGFDLSALLQKWLYTPGAGPALWQIPGFRSRSSFMIACQETATRGPGAADKLATHPWSSTCTPKELGLHPKGK